MPKHKDDPTFTPDQFTPTDFKSAADKAKYANHFVRFVRSDFKQSLFYGWFYQQTSFMWGHIAEFNAHGFYSVWCSDDASRLRFLRQVEYRPTFAGSPSHTYTDVEAALQQWVVASGVITLYRDRVAAAEEKAARATYEHLKQRFEGKTDA